MGIWQDQTFQALGKLMTGIFFKKDILGRMGRDEFVVFITNASAKELISRQSGMPEAKIPTERGRNLGYKQKPKHYCRCGVCTEKRHI